MQINRHLILQNTPIPPPITKSKSPDNLRQKIPTFKPKTLEQIFQQTKLKKSSDKTDKTIHNLKESDSLKKKNLSSKQQKTAINSLADLIAQSGHRDDIESIQYTNSQVQDKYPDEDFDKFVSQQFKQSNKYEVRVFTPQCIPFSKLGKDASLFKSKDDTNFYEQNWKQSTHWNGEITLATSMCEDDFEKALQQESQVPKQYRCLVDERYFYILCVNSQNQSQYLMESMSAIVVEGLIGKLMELEGKGLRENKVGEKDVSQRIRFLSVTEMDEFLAPEETHGHIEKYLRDNLNKKKFITLIYFVEAASGSK